LVFTFPVLFIPLGLPFIGPGPHHAIHFTVGGFAQDKRFMGILASPNGDEFAAGGCALPPNSCRAPDKTFDGIALGLNDGAPRSIASV